MTLSDLLTAAWRFRTVVLLGTAITVAAGFVSIQDRSVFWTRSEVVFLVPRNEYHPNALAASESVVIAAGAVAKTVTGPGRVPKYASPDATLVGAGIREGWSVGLPDTGGQWATNFDSQVLIIEVVGPSPQFVLGKVEELQGKVARSLDTLQTDEGVPAKNRILLKSSPEVPVINSVGGSRPRALMMTLVLGGGLTLAAVTMLEARRARRARREAQARPELVEALSG